MAVAGVGGVCAGELGAVYAYDGAEEGVEGEGGGGEVRGEGGGGGAGAHFWGMGGGERCV